jgi:hypothetical protein
MKISELQNILEHYKQENGDLEVRLIIDTHNGEEHNELSDNCIDTTQVYDKEEFNNLVNNMGLTEQQAFDNLKEEGLAATYLDIYTFI